MRRIKSEILLVGLFTLVVTVPFIKKAFHIEDMVYILGGKLLFETTLPEAGKLQVGYCGKLVPGYHATHSPLLFLFVKVLLLAGITSEVPFHLTFLIFPVVASIAMYVLARRFTKNALHTALLLAATPPFIAMSHAVMADISTLAMALVSISFYIYGVDRANIKFIIMAGIFATLAWLLSYQALFILFLFLIYPMLKKKWGAQFFLAFLIPIIVFIGWSLYTIFTYGVLHIFEALIWSSGENIIFSFSRFYKKLIGNLSQIGATCVFPLILLIPFLKKVVNKVLFGVIVMIALIISVTVNRDYTLGQNLLFILFFSTGLLVTVSFCETLANKQPDECFLGCWFLGFVSAATFLLPHSCARYLIFIFPPLLILFVRKLEDMRNCQIFIKTGLVLTLITGIFVSIADYEYAGIYSRFAEYANKKYPQAYYVGDWGFRYYMEENGYKYLLSDVDFLPYGSIIIRSAMAYPHKIHTNLRNKLRLVETKSYNGKLPLRVMNSEAKAGFYSHNYGFLPYSFSFAPLDYFDIYEVAEENYFFKNLSSAEVESPSREYKTVDIREFRINSEIRQVLFEHPWAKIFYKLKIPESASLSFGIALDPRVWSPSKGDGVQFIIEVVGADFICDTIFSKYIDPKNKLEDRKWHDEQVDLSKYAGQEVTLIFITTPGPNDDINWDWAGWSDIQITSDTLIL